MKIKKYVCRSISVWILTSLFAANIHAGEINAAVAANFTAPMEQIISLFQKETGHKVKVSFGSSGKFFSQIKEGAPFDIFLSADETNPQRLEKEGLATVETHFVYALGTLVLWSKQAGYIDDKGAVLSAGKFNKLAIPNPKLAPYGLAAKETLEKLNLWNVVQPKIVMGETITQTYQFASTENAELAFIALSQISKDGKIVGDGSHWIVPQTHYKPIRQVAVMLAGAKDKDAAKAFLKFLKNPKSIEIIKSYGYKIP